MSDQTIIPQISELPLSQPVIETFRLAALAQIESVRTWETEQLRQIDSEAGEATAAYERLLAAHQQRITELTQRQASVREQADGIVAQYEAGMARLAPLPVEQAQGGEPDRVRPYANGGQS